MHSPIKRTINRTSPPPGRPRGMVDGRSINLYLDTESLSIALALGEGRGFSAGIRRALAEAAQRNPDVRPPDE
ncbi:hypothetical protein [Fluviibacter sp.]